MSNQTEQEVIDVAKCPDDYMPFPQDETRHETNEFWISEGVDW